MRPHGVFPHRSARAAVAALVGVGVAAVIVVGIPYVSKSVETCQLGPELATGWMWTPRLLVNVPDGGGAAFSMTNGNFSFSSGSLAIAPPEENPGGGDALSLGENETGIVGDLGLAPWGFFEVHNESSAFGASGPCTQPYVAQITGPATCGAVGNLTTFAPLANNSTDAGEPNLISPNLPCPGAPNATPGDSVRFDTGYPTADPAAGHASETLSLCSPDAARYLNVSLAGLASYSVVVTFDVDGTSLSSSGFFWWYGGAGPVYSSVVYSLPNGWIWNVAEILAGSLPTVESPQTTGLLAFERLPC